MDAIGFDMAMGNPGALAFMMDAYNPKKEMRDIIQVEIAFRRMREANIKGSKLYMLWNDCCNRDTEKTLEIMREKDIKDIVDHINYEGGRGFGFED